MEYTKIMQAILNGLSGDWRRDIAYLEARQDEYKNHPMGFEVARAIGRLFYEVLPEDEKKEFNMLFQKYVLYQKVVLAEANSKIKDGDIPGAERIITKIVPSDDLFKEDAVSIYMTFKTPIEYFYYLYRFKPKKELRNPMFPFNEVYESYSYILVEKKELVSALTIIEKGLLRNPLNTHLLFERAEIYKMKGDMPTYRMLTNEFLQYLYRRGDVARYFRNIGYYFVELKQWDAAVCAYTISMWWEYSDKAAAELHHIATQTEILPKKRDITECLEVMEKEGINVRPDPAWMQIALDLGNKALEDRNTELAAYCYGVVADFMGDKNAEKMRQECMKGH